MKNDLFLIKQPISEETTYFCLSLNVPRSYSIKQHSQHFSLFRLLIVF